MGNKNKDAVQERPRKWWKSRVPIVVGVVVAVAIFYWIGKGIIENWDELSGPISEVSVWALIGAVAIHLLFSLLVSLCYYNSLRLAGADVRAITAVGIYLASQLGKYVPGKVFYVAGQIGLAKWLRISVPQSVLGFTAHHIQLAATGLLIASPLLGVLFRKEVLIGIIVLSIVGFLLLASGIWVGPFNAFQRKRLKPEMKTFSPIYAVRALLSSGFGWVCYGCVSAVLTAQLLPETSFTTLAQVGIAAVAAWLLGFLSFITPAGVGVREGTFILLTRAFIPESTAMAIALMTRLIYSVLQVLIGVMALAHSVRGRSTNAP